nr:unnamed protein product [Callosobruchus chinensis]
MVLSWINGLKLPFLKKPIQEIIPREPKSIAQYRSYKHDSHQYVHNIFLRKKRDRSERVVLNLKSLNKFIKTAHSKMEDQKLVSKLLFIYCKIRDFAHFLGNIVACCSAIKYAWAYTKRLERAKYHVLNTAADNYDSKMEIDISLKPDFDWWLDKLPTAKKWIKMDHYDMEIFSDSSLTGWRAYSNGESKYGFWTDSEKQSHKNFLELLASFHDIYLSQMI